MCRVLKRDVGRFEEALEKLKDKMLIMGYRDYDKVCADIGSLIDGEKERKKQAFGFDNDDVAGSSNITNLVDVVIRYSRPKGKDIPPDTMDRELTVFKNRLTGQTNRNGIKLFFQPESKRIAESTYAFDWELGWEEHYKNRNMSKCLLSNRNLDKAKTAIFGTSKNGERLVNT